jgi:DNA-binding FadR family transcriptional regulator
MSSHLASPNTEAAILGRLIQARDTLSREVAEYLLSIDFEPSDVERMNILSERAREGHLAAEDAAELDSYLHVGSLLSIMQSKARRLLKSGDSPSPQ